MGLCLLFGSLLIIDLRVLGFAKAVPLKAVSTFIVAAKIGITFNVITGVLFVIGDPARYFVNVALQIKMILIVIAGLNAMYFTRKVRPKMKTAKKNFKPSFSARLAALVSLVLWTCVIVLGRFIPYGENL